MPPNDGDTARIFPHRPIRRRSLKARLKRRARELGLLQYQDCYRRMVQELKLGRLKADMIEAWEPK
jgi:hypothetical protein